jgi:thiol-disulfide isomerase/thioredoxin
MLLPILFAISIAPPLASAYQSSFGLPRSQQQHKITSSHRQRPFHILPLKAVAAEFEELRREKDNNDDNNNDDDDAWIPTASGGFLPKFLRRLNNEHHDVDTHEQTVTSITEVETLQEYKRVVAQETSALVVVLFYAPWCRACKATQPLFRKLAREYNDRPSTASTTRDSQQLPVKFVRVPLTPTNGYLHAGLGVPSLPYAHIYHPTVGLVEECKLNKKVFDTFSVTLQSYVKGECELNDWNVMGTVVRTKDEAEDKDDRSTRQGAYQNEEPSLS